MIVANQFVWAHIPRTCGDLTHNLLVAADTAMDGAYGAKSDPLGEHIKHDTFVERGVTAPHYALNIRRLPSFIMSWVVMCAGRLREGDDPAFRRHGVWPAFEPLPVPSKAQLLDPSASYGPLYFKETYGSLATLPDTLLSRYLVGHDEEDVYWLRAEHIREDVMLFLDYIQLLSPEGRMAVQAATGSKRVLPYDHDPLRFFTEDEIRTLYENNPRWAAVERRYYLRDEPNYAAL